MTVFLGRFALPKPLGVIRSLFFKSQGLLVEV